MPSALASAGQGEPPLVVCNDLCVGYDGRDVVRSVCLEIYAGTFLPFVGANGAGKTTLLRTILGLLKPTGGRLRTDFGARPCGYVPQQRVIDPLLPLSTRQIVAMGLHPELGCWRRLSAAHH
ncbi:MAG: ATP-binding cassette domain-containing protein, partial [Verrucomicrobiota bacterium]